MATQIYYHRGTGGMTRNCSLKAIVLLVVLIWGALPALAQQDRYDEQDEAVCARGPGPVSQRRTAG